MMERLAELAQLIEDMTKAGVLLATEGCKPCSRRCLETKELAAGFAPMQARSAAEAMEWTAFLKAMGEPR